MSALPPHDRELENVQDGPHLQEGRRIDPRNWRPIALGNTFKTHERLDRACSSGHEICVAFLDFTDAYESIPHQALLHGLQTVSAGRHFVDIIPDLCINCTRIVAAEDIVAPIPILAGIRQGSPFSGLLFELVVDAAIHDIQG